MGFREILLNNAIQDYMMGVEFTVLDYIAYTAFVVAVVLFVYMIGYFHGKVRSSGKCQNVIKN
jgi:hypothetical protein